MDIDVTPEDLGQQLEAITASLTISRREFLDSLDSYNNSGRVLQTRVTTQLSKFIGPENNRARIIQESAQVLIDKVENYNETSTVLTQRTAILWLSVYQLVMSTSLSMLDFSIPLTTGWDENALDSTRALLDNLSEAQRRNAFLAARAVLIGIEMDSAFQVSSNQLANRQATLMHYLGDVESGQEFDSKSKYSILGSAALAGSVETNLWMLGHVLSESALAIGVNIPVAGMVISLIRIARDVRERQSAIRERNESNKRSREAGYRRSEVDAMFDLIPEIEDEDESASLALDFLSQLTADLVNTVLPNVE